MSDADDGLAFEPNLVDDPEDDEPDEPVFDDPADEFPEDDPSDRMETEP